MSRYEPARVQGSANAHFAPGTPAEPADFEPGDFILTHSRGVFASIIRFGQAIRFVGSNRRFTWWSHAALIVSPEGDLVEALGNGVRRTNISNYAATDFQLVRLESLATEHDREQIVRYGKWALGQEYDWLTIVSIALSLMTGARLSFGFDGQSICSGLVARALERSNCIFDRSPSHIMPADLAYYFSVPSPAKGSPIGEIPTP
jgi:hypothetical protein